MRKITYREANLPEGQEPLERHRSEALAAAAKIRVTLAPVHKRLTKWQSRSVFITARLAAKNPPLLELRAAAQQLLDEIQVAEQELSRVVAEDPGMAASSKIADTKKSLASIAAAMRRVIDLP